jgi:hypothetical protein
MLEIVAVVGEKSWMIVKSYNKIEDLLLKI